MAAGDLSTDQANYVSAVVAGTGLDRAVVVAWVGCESGWSITKPDHNYLNVGPARAYPNVGAAAGDAIATARDLGITRAAGAAGAAQLAAIKQSRWDAGHYAGGCLESVYNTITGGGGAQLVADDLGGLVNPRGLDPFGSAGDAAGDAIGGVAGDIVQGLAKVLLPLMLGAVFVTAAFGLIVLGLDRMTKQRISSTLRDNLQTASQAAALAAAV